MSIQYNTIENVPIATFETGWKNQSANQPLKELKGLISPSQSFNGYSAPWPPGGGKNKGQLTVPAVTRGLTFTLNADGSMTISGKATSSGGIYINDSTYDTNTTPILPAGSYTASVTSFPTSGVGSNTRFVLNAKYADDTTVEFRPLQLTSGGGILRPGKVTTTAPFKFALYMYVNLDDEFDYTMQFQLEAGSEQTDWEPYSNICPISGRTGATAYLSPTANQADASDFPVTWQTEAGTVYGGSFDFVSGTLTVTMASIASYNGETIGEPWLSSMDVYSPGATPTTGAQVVYTLATPLSYQLTANQIKTLLGVNNFWVDAGNVTVKYQYTVFDLLRVFINGYEITDLIAFGGWQRERNDVDGPEAGRTLDAKMHRARVATKMRYNVTCRPMLAGELASLERLIMPEYVTVKVVGDPYYGTWERTCYVNNTSAKYLIRKRSGAQWWGGITFPIIEV